MSESHPGPVRRSGKAQGSLLFWPTGSPPTKGVTGRPSLVVDLGGSPGYSTHFLAEIVPCARAVGLDRSESFIALALVTVLWVLIGYTLAFGPDQAGLIGGLDFMGLRHVGAAPSTFAPTVSLGCGLAARISLILS